MYAIMPFGGRPSTDMKLFQLPPPRSGASLMPTASMPCRCRNCSSNWFQYASGCGRFVTVSTTRTLGESGGFMREALEGCIKQTSHEQHQKTKCHLQPDQSVHQSSACVRIFSSFEGSDRIDGGRATPAEVRTRVSPRALWPDRNRGHANLPARTSARDCPAD